MMLSPISLVTITLVFVLSTSYILSEPLCSRYSYEESLLEKMVRMEFKMEQLQENILETNTNVKDDLVSLKEHVDGVKAMTESLKNKGKMTNTTLSVEVDQVKQDVDKLSDVVGQLMRSAKGKVTTVAFKCYGVTDTSPTSGENLVFQHIILNEGQGYNTETGEFIAPYSGLYLFTVQLGTSSSSRIAASIMVEDKEFGRVYTRGPDTYAVTGSDAVAMMTKGDRAFVKTLAMSGSLYQDSNMMISFSGVLLHEI